MTGEVEIHGSKKSLPKIMLAASLTDERCRLENVSWIEDVEVATALLRAFGRRVRRRGERGLEITGPRLDSIDAPLSFEGISGLSRVPLLALGPQLALCGEAWAPPLGGDPIGKRRIDVHLAILRKFGAEVELRNGWVRATSSRLRGASLRLSFPMVGVTEHALLTGAVAAGRTEILNAAVDPEIQEIAVVLAKMGARIELDESRRRIEIEGSGPLGGFHHAVGPDRIEAGSWASLALATNGDIAVKGVDPLPMSPFLAAFRAAGGGVTASSEGIRFTGSTATRVKVRIESGPWPAYESDWHPPMLTALTQVDGVACIHETLFESRFTTVSSLREMGAEIEMHTTCGSRRKACGLGLEHRPHRACVRGPQRLRSGRYEMSDLRGGFGLIAAALAGQGESVLTGTQLLGRGYEDLPARICRLGGELRVVA